VRIDERSVKEKGEGIEERERERKRGEWNSREKKRNGKSSRKTGSGSPN